VALKLPTMQIHNSGLEDNFALQSVPVAKTPRLQWDGPFGKGIMKGFAISFGACAAMVVIPYLISLFIRWYSKTRQRRHRDTSHSKKESKFAKSWYGWAERRKGTMYGQVWKDLSDIVWYALHWRSRTESYEWWFWDPDGSSAVSHADRRDRSVLRYLPKWMKPYRPPPSKDNRVISDIDTHDIERGPSNPVIDYRSGNYVSQLSMDGQMYSWKSPVGQTRDESLQGPRQSSSIVISGALTAASDVENASTVRRRRPSNGRPPIWYPWSEETDGASHKHRFEAEKNHRQAPATANDDRISQRYNIRTPAKPGRGASTESRRTQSMPVIADTMNPPTDGSKNRFRKTHSAEQYCSRGSGDLEAPRTPEATAPKVATTSEHDPRDTPRSSNLDTSRVPCNQGPPISFGSRIKSWTSPPGIGPIRPFDSNECNTVEMSRDFSFIAVQPPHSLDHHFDDLSAYEAEGSLDHAISDRQSSTSTRTDLIRLSQYRKHWYHPASLISSTKQRSKTHPKKLAGTDAYDSTYSLNRKARTAAAPPSSSLPIKRRRPIDRGLYVSMVGAPTDEEGTRLSAFSRSIMFQWDSVARSGTIPPSQGPFDSWRSGLKSRGSRYSRIHGEEQPTPLEPQTRYSAEHGLSNRKCQILPSRQSVCGEAEPALDEAFAQSLHSKLDRLQYELSPGFRGPPSAFGAAWGRWAPMFNPNVQMRLTSTSDIKLGKENANRAVTTPLRPTQRHATTPANVLSEKRCSNNATPNSNTTTAPPAHQHKSLHLEAQTYDPAAWILRRPPRGTESEFGPPDALYAGVFGLRRTLAEWNPSAAAVSKGLKRGSSEAELPDPPAKTMRRITELAKVKLTRGKKGWVPLGFAKRESEG